jgi:hypothetical protein
MTAVRLRAALAAAALSGVPSAVAWAVGGSAPLPATREIGRFTLGRPLVLAGAVGAVLAVASARAETSR